MDAVISDQTCKILQGRSPVVSHGMRDVQRFAKNRTLCRAGDLSLQ